MSILDETGQGETITEGWRALELFTDRREAIRLFSSYLNDEPPHKSILFFYGDGGNGKSLLLRYLRDYYCKHLRPENWEYVKNSDDEEFARHIKEAEGAQTVPSVMVDFGMQPRGDDRPQEAFSALLMMRRDLSRNGMRSGFPLYDFASVWYLHRTGQLTKERIKSLFPAEEMDFITEITDAVSGTAWAAMGKAVLNIFGKRLSERFTLYKHRRNLDESKVEEIQRMDPDKELMDQLPRLFAEDLNAAMALDNAPKRIALFFDTHEAFWGNQRNLSDDLYFQRDEWLRRLLGKLDFSSGIVAVVAGRDRPGWAKASKVKVPESYLDIQFISHLSEADAVEYLERAGIADAAMRECLFSYASVEPGQAHPLYLGLCADIVLAASAKGEALKPDDFRAVPEVADRAATLVNRLLRYVDTEIEFAVKALSACRSFNRDIYFKLGAALNFQATEPAFGVLTKFSFVWRTEQRGDGWYRIHDLLRRLSREQNDEVAHRAHEVLEGHYRERGEAGEAAAVAEAIYHANRLDWERGVIEWVEVFDKALELSRYELCGVLLEVRSELIIETDFEVGRISQSEGDYFTSLSRHDEARKEYSESIAAFDEALRRAPDDVAAHNNKGLTLLRLGEIQAGLSQHEEAIESCLQSLDACDAAIQLVPDFVMAHSNRGGALLKIGEIQTELSHYKKAITSYENAINALNEAVQHAPDLAVFHNNKGLALLRLGEVQARLSLNKEAIESCLQAITACDDALQLASDFIMAYSNKGGALLILGQVQAGLSQHEKAIGAYLQAITTFDDALRFAPNLVVVHSNKGLALLSLGEIQTSLSRHEEAIESCLQAITSCDEALQLAPDFVMAHGNRGFALLRLAEAQAGLSKNKEAIGSCLQAIAAFDNTLRLAPDQVMAHNGKGLVLLRLGEIYTGLLKQKAAINSYRQAIFACDEALRLAPDFVMAHNNRGIAQLRLGELQANMSNPEEAIESYKQAVISFDNALQLAPDYVIAQGNKGLALLRLGEAQTGLSQHKEAMESCLQAIVVYDEALRLAPDFVAAHSNKGLALLKLGEVQTALLKSEEALEKYKQAIAACDDALRLAPDFVMAHNIKGYVLASLGVLQADLSKHAEAISSLQAALDQFSRSLEIAPGDRQVREWRDEVQERLNELRGM